VHIEERYSESVHKQVDKKPIVHRDLKPQNIMLDKKNVLKVVDFGLAKETIGGVGSTMNVKGTKEWMAPEQVSQSCCPLAEMHYEYLSTTLLCFSSNLCFGILLS